MRIRRKTRPDLDKGEAEDVSRSAILPTCPYQLIVISILQVMNASGNGLCVELADLLAVELLRGRHQSLVEIVSTYSHHTDGMCERRSG